MSDNPWYGLVTNEQQSEWDKYDPIPEPGVNPALDSFVKAKRLTHASLVRLGARVESSGHVFDPVGRRWRPGGAPGAGKLARTRQRFTSAIPPRHASQRGFFASDL